jgi:D-amino-acid dehydrogenase
MSDVVVVGGGVIGLCVAEALQRRGAGVTVLDAGHCGAAASAGNGGWVTPGLCTPLSAPGTMGQALRWMLRPDSPLLLRPSVNPEFLRWSVDFARSTSVRRYRAGLAALVPLGERSLEAFDELRDAGVGFEMHADGLLFAATSLRHRDEELRVLRELHAYGYQGRLEVLDAGQARALEPTLGEAVAGAILAADERHVRPEQLTAGLAEHLRAAGTAIHEHTPVTGLWRDGLSWRVELDGGDSVRARRVVVAAGTATATLLAPLGLRLPLQGAKGYSVTDAEPALRPARPLYLLEAKVGVSPFAGGVRLAGTLELGSSDPSLNRRRLAALDAAAVRYLDGWRPGGGRREWAGFRPTLPDGLPAIGPVAGHDGVFVATGHQMLGVTLAPATAKILAPAVLDGGRSLELAPFSPDRFGRGRHNGRAEPEARFHRDVSSPACDPADAARART